MKTNRGYLVIYLLVPVFLLAQEHAILFRHISLEDGLSQSTANCIVQDHKGFIWIGTEDGLNRYDGYTFKVYKPVLQDTTSISNNSIWALHVDTDNMLWVGTFGGLNRFDPSTERFKRYLHDPENPKSLSHNHVKVIYEDTKGVLWIGTNGGGLC
ncbi:histidine kinase, partial [Methanosarcinales archaeon]